MSAAEGSWPSLLQTLKLEVDGIEIPIHAASVMSYIEKMRLIQAGPATCARNYSYRVHCLMETLFKIGVLGPLGIIGDRTIRVEFQQRCLAYRLRIAPDGLCTCLSRLL